MGAYEKLPIDFGDAPDSNYATLLDSDGARHVIGKLWLGNAADKPDHDEDGRPDIDCLGDDADGNDDENGVDITSLMAGTTNSIMVTVSDPCSVGAVVELWIDFSGDGDWDDPDEFVYNNSLENGENWIDVPVPLYSPTGRTYARCRISSQGTSSPTGIAPDGEVEDYVVDILSIPLDYGDAPDPNYPTLSTSNGACHHVTGGLPWLGALVDSDTDGQPDSEALGDDSDAQGDDEDGVTFPSVLIVGVSNTIGIQVEAGGPFSSAWVDLWIDYNADGNWDEQNEHVFSGSLRDGYRVISVTPPVGSEGLTYARCRINSGGPLEATGFAPDGEVEDYSVEITPAFLDFGDAPGPYYPTLLANDGARHFIAGPWFGRDSGPGDLDEPDMDMDGQPDSDAMGDDLNYSDDEDAVLIPNLKQGTSDSISIFIAGGGGIVELWIDWNADGDWNDVNELVYNSFAGGPFVSVNVNVPQDAEVGTTFARCRISTEGTGSPTGLAYDGEVEDHKVTILQSCSGCADFDHSGTVGVTDLRIFTNNWLWQGPSGGYNVADLNCNGSVDFKDFASLALQWLNSCP